MHNTKCKKNLQILSFPAAFFYFPFSSGNRGRSRRPAKITTSTETTEAPQTAGIISNGAAAPSDDRTAATVEGMSWMEAEFSVTSVSTASGAPRLPHTVYSRSAARRPIGVEALESPGPETHQPGNGNQQRDRLPGPLRHCSRHLRKPAGRSAANKAERKECDPDPGQQL